MVQDLLVDLDHLVTDLVELCFGGLELKRPGLVFRQLALELLGFGQQLCLSGFELVALFCDFFTLFTQISHLHIEFLDELIFLLSELSDFHL